MFFGAVAKTCGISNAINNFCRFSFIHLRFLQAFENIFGMVLNSKTNKCECKIIENCKFIIYIFYYRAESDTEMDVQQWDLEWQEHDSYLKS